MQRTFYLYLFLGLCLVSNFLSQKSFAQTYNANTNIYIYISAMEFVYRGGDDGFGSNECRLSYTADNPLTGAAPDYSVGCFYHDGIDNASGTVASNNAIADAIGSFTVTTGSAIPNYISVNFSAHEDDSFISNCTFNSGDDDLCNSGTVNIPLTGFMGGPGSITQVVTCGDWDVSFLVQMAVRGSNSCASPTPFCTGAGLLIQAPTTGTAPGSNYYGCLGSTPGPSWYYMKLGVGGSLDIQLSAGSDVDYILYGPYPTLAAATADCGSFAAADVEDCSYSISPTEHINITGGIAGEVYILLVTNYSGATQNLTLAKFAGDAETDCSIIDPCLVTNLTTTTAAQTLCYNGAGASAVTFSAPPTGTSRQYLLVDNSTNIIWANNSTGIFTEEDIPDNVTTTCPAPATKNYRVYALNYDTENGLQPITNGTSNIIVGNANVIKDANGDPLMATPNVSSCMDVSSGFAAINVLSKVWINWGTQTCNANNLTYNQVFSVCGGSGAGYSVSLIAGSGTVAFAGTTGTVSNISEGTAITLRITDGSGCTWDYSSTALTCATCGVVALTTASPTQTLCFDGAGIASVTFSAASTNTSVQYLLVDPATNIVVANNSTGAFLATDIPDNVTLACPSPTSKAYRIYALNYDTNKGLTPIVNGTTSITVGNANVVKDGRGNGLLAAPSLTACMRLSAQFVTINVRPKLFITWGTQTCSANNLTYNQTLTICGGNGSYTGSSLIAGNGVFNLVAGAGTVSNITQGTAITIRALDGAGCSQEYTSSVKNCTSCPTNPGVFPFAN